MAAFGYPHRQLDLTERLVSAMAEELWRLHGGNDELNWPEAELQLRRIVGEARAEALNIYAHARLASRCAPATTSAETPAKRAGGLDRETPRNAHPPGRAPGDDGSLMAPDTTTTVLLIAGMRNMVCGERVASALRTVTGVTKAEVEFWKAKATVTHHSPCEASQLIRAVVRMGFGAMIDCEDRR